MPTKPVKAAQIVDNHPDKVGMDRLIFFSDAVFAIAITLLILEIQLPDLPPNTATNAQLGQSLVDIWPKYLAYAISFLVIGLFWIGHHRKFRFIQKYDNNLLLLNLIWLMFIAFIPFPTSILSKYGNQTATVFYALVIIANAIISILLWLYASHHDRLIDPAMSTRQRRREIIGPLFVGGVFVLSIGLASINPSLARLSWIIVAVGQRFYN